MSDAKVTVGRIKFSILPQEASDECVLVEYNGNKRLICRDGTSGEDVESDRSMVDSFIPDPAPQPENAVKCTWTGETGYSVYNTSCGQTWEFMDGDMSENKITFCPFCGGKIEENTLEDEVEDA